MSSDLDYRSLTNSQEEQQLREIISQCFGVSPADWQRYFRSIGGQNFRTICRGKKVVGGLAIYPMGQWYGGQPVPMAGIASVGIAPEARGTGAAYQLMSHTLQELHSLNIPISVLYAAAQRLYRKVGYEQAGTRAIWEILAARINKSDRRLTMERVNPAKYELFQQIYTQQAQINNGNLNRHQAIWQQIIELPQQAIYAYLIGSQTQPEGYLIFTQRREEGLSIYIRDWAVVTESAAQRIWTFLGDHRSSVKQIKWQSGSIDQLSLLLSEQTAKISEQERWMLRIINLPLALQKRGYPVGIETELHLEVEDPLIAANNGKFCLQVSQGRGKITAGGRGEFQIKINGLAPLYTGLLTPHQLQLLGYLKTTEEALAKATLIFAGGEPWMPDFF